MFNFLVRIVLFSSLWLWPSSHSTDTCLGFRGQKQNMVRQCPDDRAVNMLGNSVNLSQSQLEIKNIVGASATPVIGQFRPGRERDYRSRKKRVQ